MGFQTWGNRGGRWRAEGMNNTAGLQQQKRQRKEIDLGSRGI